MEIIGVYILFAAGLYFFMIRPQQKRAREVQQTRNSLQKGDRVITIGGLHGVVEELNETTIVLDCEGVYLEFERRAIAQVVPQNDLTMADLQSDNTETSVVESVQETANEETVEVEVEGVAIDEPTQEVDADFADVTDSNTNEQ